MARKPDKGKKPDEGKKRPRTTPSWLIRAADLAKLLGVGPRTLTRMIQERKIGPKRIIPHRRSIGWDRTEIEVWLRLRGPDGQWYDEDSWAKIRDAMMAQHYSAHSSGPSITSSSAPQGLDVKPSVSSAPSLPSDSSRSDGLPRRGKLR